MVSFRCIYYTFALSLSLPVPDVLDVVDVGFLFLCIRLNILIRVYRNSRARTIFGIFELEREAIT